MSEETDTDKDGLPPVFWEVLLKINLTIVPILMSGLIAWGVWMTGQAYKFDAFMKSGERFTQQDGRELKDALIIRTETLMRGIDSKVSDNTRRMNSLERDTEKILIIVERLDEESKQ